MRAFLVVCVAAAFALASADASLRSLTKTSSLPTCQLCYPGTDGPCQQSNSVCWHKNADHKCPTGTSLCKCDGCTSGSGPCMDCEGKCHNYISEDLAVCPLFTRRCTDHLPTCTACYSGTSGPCQQANGVCWDFLQAGDYDCPVGTQVCSCPRCKSGTHGRCYKPDGTCTDKDEAHCKSPNWYCSGLPSFLPA